METQESSLTIQNLFTAHKLDARVIGGNDTPRVTKFFVELFGSTTVKQLRRLQEDLAYRLGVDNLRISRKGAKLSIEILKSDFDTIFTSGLIERMPKDENVYALLGVDLDNSVLVLKLNSADIAHVLVSGTTGSGKTELMKTILGTTLLNQPDMHAVVIDPKGSDYNNFDGQLRFPRAIYSEDAILRLEWIVSEMEVRSLNNVNRPFIMLVIDELADFLQVGGKEASEQLTRLLARGRSAGICVVAGTQKPLMSSIGSLVKANFPVRLVGRVVSPEESKVSAGIADVGAEQLQGHGDFLLVALGEVTRFQAAVFG